LNRQLCALVMGLAAEIALLGSGFAVAAETLQGVVRVGFVGPESSSTAPRGIPAFWQRLRELGYVEGENLAIESGWAEGRYERLPALMVEVLSRKVDILVTFSTPAGLAAKNATSKVPIVVAIMGEPVSSGLVESLAHPGGNVTGLSLAWADGIGSKWLELLQEAVPKLSTVAVLCNPDNVVAKPLLRELRAVSPVRQLQLRIIEVRAADGLSAAFEQARRDPLTVYHRRTIAALAAKHRLPVMYALRDFADSGGLMAYAPDTTVMFRRAAEYVDKIIKGARPAQLPVEQPTAFQLIVNLKAARSLGLTIPESILARADEVIR
jgi:putative tryptophan/tyrosine transport system substrate-binding protein